MTYISCAWEKHTSDTDPNSHSRVSGLSGAKILACSSSHQVLAGIMLAISWHLPRVPQLIPPITRLNSHPSTRLSKKIRRGNYHHRLFSYSYRYRYSGEEEEEEELGRRHSPGRGFEDAVLLFNRREYYECHDVLESIWLRAEEPARTLVHAILQCAVGFYHLLNHVSLSSLLPPSIIILFFIFYLFLQRQRKVY